MIKFEELTPNPDFDREDILEQGVNFVKVLFQPQGCTNVELHAAEEKLHLAVIEAIYGSHITTKLKANVLERINEMLKEL